MDGLVAIARCRGSFLFRFRGHSGCSAQALSFESKDLPIKHIPGPEGVRGRNSDNTLIKQVLGWAPQTTLKEGLGITYKWIEEQVGKYGADTKALTTSTVVGQTMTDSCDMGSAAGK